MVIVAQELARMIGLLWAKPSTRRSDGEGFLTTAVVSWAPVQIHHRGIPADVPSRPINVPAESSRPFDSGHGTHTIALKTLPARPVHHQYDHFMRHLGPTRFDFAFMVNEVDLESVKRK